jgi:hypothetical protein
VCTSKGGSVVTIVERMTANDSISNGCGSKKYRAVKRFTKNCHPRSFNSQTKKSLISESRQPAVPLNCKVVKFANRSVDLCQEVWRCQRRRP